MTQGIKFVNANSLWWQLLILWGFFWLMTVGFWVFINKQLAKNKKVFVGDFIVWAMTFWATVLIVIPELIYVKDIYIAEHHRANTMFKLVYQSFVIYCLATGYIVIRIKEHFKKKIFKVVYLIPFIIGFSAQMIYPYFAIKGYYGDLRKYKGIWGLDFLKKQYPGDYDIVNWLNRNVTGQPVILEAVGDSYTLYNHTSALTGLPTIEGWLVHEWLWRGGYDQPGSRAEEVKQVYQGESDQKAEEILQNYQVKYVLVGPLEREKYPELKEERFKQLGKTVFSSHTSRLYKLEI